MSTCETCRFWSEPSFKRPLDRRQGWCKRFPPTVLARVDTTLDGGNNEEVTSYLESTRPVTSHDDFCGEYATQNPKTPQTETNPNYQPTPWAETSATSQKQD